MMKRVILLLLFLAFINVVSAGVVDTKNMTIIHPCTNTSEGTCETMVRNGLTVYEGLVFPESIDINNTTGLGYISWGIANDNNSRGAISHPCSPTVNTSGYSRSCSAFYVNGKLSSITKFTAVIHPCTGTSKGGSCTDTYREYIPLGVGLIYTSTSSSSYTNENTAVTSTPTVIAAQTPANPTNTPITIVSPIPSEVDMNNSTIVQPCDDNSNKICESIIKNGVTVYKGPVYPETIDINNPSEPIFPIKDPNPNNVHVGISHSCYPTGNTPTYSQICDASYINGRLTYIIKYIYREYPCSITDSGICRENSQESIPVRTPIVLTDTPTVTNTVIALAIAGSPSEQINTRLDYTIERISIRTNDPQPTEVATPRLIETPEPKEVTSSDIITFVTPTSVPIHEEQSQQETETKISWLESIKSILDFIKSIF